MPPLILWATGALGVVALTRLLGAAARKVNAELDEIRGGKTATMPMERLERDPATGIYKPRKS